MHWQGIVAPLATAVVGVVGLCTTWLTSRGQRQHQDASEVRSIRRDVYARFLAAIRQGRDLISQARLEDERHADATPTGPEDLLRVSGKIFLVLQELVLVGSKDVADVGTTIADELIDDLGEVAAKGKEGGSNAEDRTPIATLLTQMRQDLLPKPGQLR